MSLYEEFGNEPKMRKNLIFSSVFIIENMLHAIVDRNNNVSCKQWLLMAFVKQFPYPVDLTTLGEALGCSRQNIKKLALQLEKEGYIKLFKSETDARKTCIQFTKKGEQFNEKNTELSKKVFENLYSEFTKEDIDKYFELSVKMMHGIEKLEQFFNENGK